MSKAEKDTIRLTGKKIQIDENRSVSVSHSDEEGDSSFYLNFVNTEGDETKIRLSQEAVIALMSLLSSDRLVMEYNDGWRRVL